MRRALVPLAAPALALALTACGAQTPQLDDACARSPIAIERALARAPAPVALPSGTRLSQCVADARSDADLQSVGIVLTQAADALAATAQRGDARSAVRLGYLVGATRRGAATTGGIHAELQRRIERSAAALVALGPRVAAALRRGARAGQATG